MGGDITGERFCYHNNIASYPGSWWGGPEYEATIQQLLEVTCSSSTSGQYLGLH